MVPILFRYLQTLYSYMGCFASIISWILFVCFNFIVYMMDNFSHRIFITMILFKMSYYSWNIIYTYLNVLPAHIYYSCMVLNLSLYIGFTKFIYGFTIGQYFFHFFVMIILTRNVRGVGWVGFTHEITKLSLFYHPDIIFLMETKVKSNRADKIIKKFKTFFPFVLKFLLWALQEDFLVL